MKFNTPEYFGIVIEFDFLGVLTFIPLSSNLLNQPPGLDKFARASGEPIAFISNGDPIFSPFIFMMFPPHIIGVVNIIL